MFLGAPVLKYIRIMSDEGVQLFSVFIFGVAEGA